MGRTIRPSFVGHLDLDGRHPCYFSAYLNKIKRRAKKGIKSYKKTDCSGYKPIAKRTEVKFAILNSRLGRSIE